MACRLVGAKPLSERMLEPALPRCLSNIRAIGSFWYLISQLRDSTKFNIKTSYRLANRTLDAAFWHSGGIRLPKVPKSPQVWLPVFKRSYFINYKMVILCFALRRSVNKFTTWRNGCMMAWWRHQMETFSVLLALCVVTGEFSSQRPATRSFDVVFDLRLNKRLSKQSRRQWFKTQSRSLWRHCIGNNSPCITIIYFQESNGEDTDLECSVSWLV